LSAEGCYGFCDVFTCERRDQWRNAAKGQLLLAWRLTRLGRAWQSIETCIYIEEIMLIEKLDTADYGGKVHLLV
jgi:hypothetical protein